MGCCSLCGGVMEVRFSVRDHLRPADGTLYRVEWCTPCGYGRVQGEFDSAAVSQFYTSNYLPHAEEVACGRASRWLDRLRVSLAWRLDRGASLEPGEIARTLSLTGSHPSLCDLGCGAGQFMKMFALAGYDVMGIEPDPQARQTASQFGPVLAGTAEALPDEVRGQQFSVVLLAHVLEHCMDPVAALSNVKQLLAPGGTAVIEVPNHASAGFRIHGPGWFLSDAPRHLHFFTRNSLDRTLEAAGLKVVRRIYRGYTRQMGPNWLGAERLIRERAGLPDPPCGPWELLARTVLASVDSKYDSIRVHAIHL